MRLFLRIIAAGITLIAVFLLPLALSGYLVGQILYSPKAMLNLVATNMIGPAQSNFLTETLLRSLPQQLGIPSDTVIGKALIEAAEQPDLQLSILPADLQLIYVAQGISAFYDWLEGPQPMPIIALEMGPLKEHIGQNAPRLVGTVIEQVPVCSADESFGLALNLINALLSGEAILDALPDCLPDIVPLDAVAPAVGSLLQQQLTLVPETVVLDNLITASPESMLKLKQRLQLAKGVLRWSWLPLVFLLLIAAFAGGQTGDGIVRWLGWSLLLAGLWTFLFSLIPTSWWLAGAVPLLSDWPILLKGPAVAILDTVFDQARQSLFWFVIGMTAAGLVMLILAFIFRPKQRKSI
ncbi:MAG: hypothetical protein R3293_08990 [Candidatus Promineifilaceae bacterium]|nr:hypothetical protein [Candidatus Promineifilaceae bacterium]